MNTLDSSLKCHCCKDCTLCYTKEENIKKQIQLAFKLIFELQPDRERLMNPIPETFNPFWNHPYNVLKKVIQLGSSDKETLIAAVLHDVLEDTDCPEEEIGEIFGQEVLEIVKTVSKPKNYTKKDSGKYYSGIYKHEDEGIRQKACCIKIADRIDNLSEATIVADHSFTKEYFLETKKYFPKIAKVINREKEFNEFLKNIDVLVEKMTERE